MEAAIRSVIRDVLRQPNTNRNRAILASYRDDYPSWFVLEEGIFLEEQEDANQLQMAIIASYDDLPPNPLEAEVVSAPSAAPAAAPPKQKKARAPKRKREESKAESKSEFEPSTQAKKKPASECVICLSKAAVVTVVHKLKKGKVSDGHQCLCEECAKKVGGTCPVCRVESVAFLGKIY